MKKMGILSILMSMLKILIILKNLDLYFINLMGKGFKHGIIIKHNKIMHKCMVLLFGI